jgi:hypothetical protein
VEFEGELGELNNGLKFRLYDVRVLPEHLEQLAELPSLHFLHLFSTGFDLYSIGRTRGYDQEKLGSASGFPCLTHLELHIPVLVLQFEQGAMPKLQKLHLTFDPIQTNKYFQTNNFDYGFKNLPSLRHLVIGLNYCDEANDAIRKAVNDHPNHPSLHFSNN